SAPRFSNRPPPWRTLGKPWDANAGSRGYILGMDVRKVALLVAAAALMGGTAARAADAKSSKPIDFTVRTETSPIAPGAQTVKWDAAKGRWGVTVNLQQ